MTELERKTMEQIDRMRRDGRAVCDFRLAADGLWVCPACGRTKPNLSLRHCDPENQEKNARRPLPAKRSVRRPANWARLAWRYAASTWAWWFGTRELRSHAEIEKIMDNHCRPCPMYRSDQGGYCQQCGCSVSGQRNGWLNKLARRDEKCPEGKW